ncbi:MAG TPA: hypothetical protein VGR67_01130 [Candidatus Polarisedimenticolia bacterium]|jgi:hypothetical protein|nr:hypothetical protein [Candidatus Polarisedimenticolia bacterium]
MAGKTHRRGWLPPLWGAALGVAAASYLWGSSSRVGLVIGEKIMFTLVIPMIAIFVSLAISLSSLGRKGPPPSS